MLPMVFVFVSRYDIISEITSLNYGTSTKTMSLQYLKDAAESGDQEALIRYVRLHFGDGDEATGAQEIDKAWAEALKLLLDVPETEREFILETLSEKSPETLAHLFFHLHFYFVQKSGEWIHDGNL